MPPSDDDNALSGDEDEEESPAEEHVARVRPGAAKKALGRAAGSKRVKQHDLPIPINYQEMAGDTVGWQEYSLADGTRLYNRLAFRYEEDFKTTGNVIAIRPPPPKAFSWTHLNYMATALTTDSVDKSVTTSEKLVRGLSAIIVRVAFGYFKGDDLKVAPTSEALLMINQELVKVFGVHPYYREWTRKQVMGWAWPEIPLVGSALMYYQGAALSAIHRDATSLLELVLLSAPNGKDTFVQLFKQSSRLQEMAPGPLRTALKLLSTIVREGVVIFGVVQVVNQKETREVQHHADDAIDDIFDTFNVTHGKASPNLSSENYQMGDPFELKLFDKEVDNEDTSIEVFHVVCTSKDLVKHDVKLSGQEAFLYNLTVPMLVKMMLGVQKTLLNKRKSFSASLGKRPASGLASGMAKKHLSQDGRIAMQALKCLLEVTPTTTLKKMIKALQDAQLVPEGIDDNVREVADKSDMQMWIAGVVLPTYPYDDPFAKVAGAHAAAAAAAAPAEEDIDAPAAAEEPVEQRRRRR